MVYLLDVDLSAEQCFAAIASKDARFDGRLFVGVTSTGIYCRPICAARPPRRENMVFFGGAAAAEKAGFRACRRCRPETAPGSPAWVLTRASVSRALRLIEEGGLDDGGIEGVAGRLGMTGRHLRRLFAEHLGASPRRVAVGQRRGDEIRLQVAVRAPYDWQRLIGFLTPRVVPRIEAVTDGVYRRRVNGGIVEVRARSAAALEVSIPAGCDPFEMVQRVRRMFDVASDPRAIASVLRQDDELSGRVRRRPGLRIPGGWDGFEVAVRAVLGQQITMRGATTLCSRVVEQFGERIDDGELGWAFPAPARLAEADVARIGVPGRRADAVRALSAAVASGALALDGGFDSAQVISAMTALPGIGAWTANYVAMRACGDPDAFPTGDLVLCKALALSPRELSRRAESWRPWRAYAAIQLWEES